MPKPYQVFGKLKSVSGTSADSRNFNIGSNVKDSHSLNSIARVLVSIRVDVELAWAYLLPPKVSTDISLGILLDLLSGFRKIKAF